MSQSDFSGILNINKPTGITSHDVVNQVRKLFGIRKVGHAGTLDPLATGVLLVCLGQATRLIEYLMTGQKVYRATILFGQATDTYDADGEIVAQANPAGLTEKEVRQTFLSFVGTISQVPPPFSAIKKRGVPLYKLARAGVTVKPEPRLVQIDALELIEWRPPEVVIDITCQSGTYIRSLAHDAGQSLGVGAHLTKLIRLASGDWRLKEAISLPMLKQVVSAKKVHTVLQPKEKALATWPSLVLSVEQAQAIRFGQSITYQPPLTDHTPLIAGYETDGQLVAILQVTESGHLKPKKVFKQRDKNDHPIG